MWTEHTQRLLSSVEFHILAYKAKEKRPENNYIKISFAFSCSFSFFFSPLKINYGIVPSFSIRTFLFYLATRTPPLKIFVLDQNSYVNYHEYFTKKKTIMSIHVKCRCQLIIWMLISEILL